MFKLVNATPKDVYIAYMFWARDICGADGDFQAIGWFYAPPGQSVVVYGNSMKDVPDRIWCYYAHSFDREYIWEGPYATTVPVAAFNQCYLDGEGGETGQYEEIGFRSFNTGFVDDFTMTLTL